MNRRRISRDDVEDVASLHEEQNQRAADRRYIEQCIRDYPSSIVRQEGRIVGFAYTDRFAPDLLSLSNLLVAEDVRGRQVGSILLEHVEQQAAKDWAGIILSNSELWNHPPRRSPLAFYEKHGYVKVWETEHTVVLAKDLTRTIARES